MISVYPSMGTLEKPFCKKQAQTYYRLFTFKNWMQMLRNGAWEQIVSALEPPVKDKLSKYQI